MTLGARHITKPGAHQKAATAADTLIMDVCVRRCAVDALNAAVRLDYVGPEAPRPYATPPEAPAPPPAA